MTSAVPVTEKTSLAPAASKREGCAAKTAAAARSSPLSFASVPTAF